MFHLSGFGWLVSKKVWANDGRVVILHMRASTLGLLAGLMLSLPQAVLAWADGGHKAIGILAWEKLTAEERVWVVSLLEQHPLWDEHFKRPMDAELGSAPAMENRQQWLFAQAAVWPDIIRGPRGAAVNPWEKWHRPFWHYIDYPVFPSDEVRARMEATAKTGPMDWQPGRAEFLEAKLNAVQTLKKALHDLADTSIPATDRAVMLCWLFHLVGDIHQPCHCATLFAPEKLATGDRGGNGTTIEGLPARPLHAYWDDLLGAPGTSLADARKTADELLAIKLTAVPGTPENWAHQSNAAAKRHVYHPL